MIPEDELSGLSDDPDEAFSQFVDIVSRRYTLEADENTDVGERRYVMAINEFCIAYDYALRDELPLKEEGQTRFGYYLEFRYAVDSYVLRRRLQKKAGAARQVNTLGSLSSAARNDLQVHIGKIKSVIVQLDIPDNKREALLSKLGALDYEINTNRTRAESIASFAVLVALTAEECGKRVLPLEKAWSDLLTHVGRAWSEVKALFPPTPRPQIEPPKGG